MQMNKRLPRKVLKKQEQKLQKRRKKKKYCVQNIQILQHKIIGNTNIKTNICNSNNNQKSNRKQSHLYNNNSINLLKKKYKLNNVYKQRNRIIRMIISSKLLLTESKCSKCRSAKYTHKQIPAQIVDGVPVLIGKEKDKKQRKKEEQMLKKQMKEQMKENLKEKDRQRGKVGVK
ncbi:Hypothetical_protein [Hexamita inflata]|uniref:Hypothetical_protein n=1 Tax=Hexamita inflata TaxID=28002 RepID=A0AA86Q842_9EUKA|nr:Hypothetical protein HINF_LOCUS35587 [Hexamita inflata]